MLLWKPSFSLMRMLVSLKTTDKNEQIDAGMKRANSEGDQGQGVSHWDGPTGTEEDRGMER